MEDQAPKQLQLFARLLDGKTATLIFASSQVYGHQIKQRICDLTSIPTRVQRLICGVRQIDDGVAVSWPDATVNLVLSLRGGKGGFGSLLRGAATKAGQKKTNNFDACRDMSGRRLRHVNAEKRLEEWKAEEEGRKLEKLAEEFLKKQAKKGKQGVGDGAVKKYVEKYREESAKCVEAVDLAVREALKNGKRKENSAKAEKGSGDSKRMKIWIGKRVMGDSDSELSSDEEDNEESEKSVILNNGSRKARDESSGSVTGGAQNGESAGGVSSESGSDEEKESVFNHQISESDRSHSAEDNVAKEEKVCVEVEISDVKMEEDLSVPKSENLQEAPFQPAKTSDSENIQAVYVQISDYILKPGVGDETDMANAKEYEEKPFNLDDFKTASDLEVMGMERLKSELQARGLKCGGTLHERAARLFLLKSTSLDKIPKKLLAKK